MENSLKNKFMRLAIKEAKKGYGNVSPNPLVGAVIINNSGKIIGKGAHLKYGKNHAEVNAIESCIESPKGAMMFVTLEPCNHYGNTPPCSERIIKEGIKKVYIGVEDRNEIVQGSGIKRLEEAGIKVEVGILENEINLLNESFFHYINYKRPFILLKSAITLDGAISTENGESKWISSEKSRKQAHKLRSIYDAIMIGKNTALVDNPKLNSRIKNGQDPIRIVLDRKLEVPLDYKVYSDELTSKTIVFCSILECDSQKLEILRDRNITVIDTIVKKDRKIKTLDLKFIIAKLGEMKITSLLVEGGAILSTNLLKLKLVDRINLFIAPKIVGSTVSFVTGELGITKIDEAIELKDVSYKKIENDIMIDGLVSYKETL